MTQKDQTRAHLERNKTRLMKIKYFRTPAELRQWFEKHHETEQKLQVGYYKKGSDKQSITWPESVDALLVRSFFVVADLQLQKRIGQAKHHLA